MPLSLHCLVTLMQTWNKTGNSKVPLCVSFPQLLSQQGEQSQPPFPPKTGPRLSRLWRQRMGLGRDTQRMRAREKTVTAEE